MANFETRGGTFYTDCLSYIILDFPLISCRRFDAN